MRSYTPRRASSRWLDGDCPAEVLAIFDHPKETDRYTVFYREILKAPGYGYDSLGYISVDENGSHYHGELKTHEVAAYRYRNKHRYATWSSLPDVVKSVVRRDLDRE